MDESREMLVEELKSHFTHKNKDYVRKCRLITGNMNYEDSAKTLIIWKRKDPFNPADLKAELRHVRQFEDVKYHFLPLNPRLCAGATVKFEDSDGVEAAATKLKHSFRFGTAFPYSVFLNAVVEAEIRHPKCEGNLTRLVVRGKLPFKQPYKLRFENELLDFGNCETIRYAKPRSEYGIICVITYRFATPAIAAMLILNGFPTGRSGVLSVLIQKSSKVNDMLEYVQSYLS